MIHFFPFRGIRPTRDKVHLTASRSYVTYTPGELREKLATNPFSFLHIIHPPTANKLKGTERYLEVRHVFQQFQDKGIFIREDQEAFYLYEQTYQGKTYRGWIGAVSTKDYDAGHIKVHENTLTQREEMFREYLEVTGFNAEPVLLAHRDDVYLEDFARAITRERAEYEFTTTDRILHKLWVITGGSNLEYIRNIFAKHQDLYIADGHHRSASSALLGRGKPANNPAAGCLAFLLPQSALSSKPFYRLLKIPTIESIEDFSRIINTKDLPFQKIDDPDNFEVRTGVLAFDSSGAAVHITKWPERENDGILEKLPTSRLYQNILKPIGGINDDRNDKRLHYEPSTHSFSEICAYMRKKKIQLGFLPPAISFETVMKIADAGLTMPPKSTYIEPKLRSGLIVYPLEHLKG
ncbi:MAG: DUF1015 domain-containing protein [Cryomorphaceae bacterium]|nr:DUF1015 domain-containing protein [Cryomorphaceae bacterium]